MTDTDSNIDARWNGQIIGQGGPTDEQFANLWTQLATKYASEEKMIFGVMNEVCLHSLTVRYILHTSNTSFVIAT